MKAYEGFPEVHSHPLIVRQQPMNVTTMQAQPVASLSFFSKKNRKYIIRLNQVPESSAVYQIRATTKTAE